MTGMWFGVIRAAAVAVVWSCGATAALAQQAWVQIEARPSEDQALERAREYAQRLPDVNAYALGSGWYGIALGPYGAADARTVLAQLLGSAAIPADSFIADGSQFGAQIYPGGATAPAEQTASAPAAETPPDAPVAIEPASIEPAVNEPAPAPIPDETRAEALASENLLTGPEKELLQIGLQWAGFYASAIDGAFGPGTRNAMAAWQAANGFETTGVLTTGQRAALLRSYNAVLDGMDMSRISDPQTGIEIEIPAGAVQFTAYAPPFARFEARGAIPATVLLISQPGDASRLAGLYEIMQTLDVIPPEGPRARSDAGFTIEGQNARLQSYTEVSLENGEIKGFTLVWPAGDTERQSRILALMQASFTRIPGVLDPGLASPGEEQSVDLVSGLAIRQPILSRSGFYLDADGTVATTIDAVQGCGRILLDDLHPARVIHTDAGLGLAVLRPDEPIAPLGVAAFQVAEPRLQSDVAVAGFPYGGLLSAPALTFGRLADLRGLDGEAGVQRLDLAARDGDAGGPVLDASGAVIGMLLPRAAGDLVLPPDVGFAASAQMLMLALNAQAVPFQTTQTTAAVTREMLTRQADALAVMVSCWE